MTDNFNKDEFSGKNALKGLGRAALLLVGIFLAVLGAIHWIFGILAIAALSWGIYISSKDESKLKYLNIGLRVVFIIIALLFLVQGLSMY